MNVAVSVSRPVATELVTRRTPVRRSAAFFLLGLTAYQAFHLLEHGLETVQLHLLHHEHAHTRMGGADFGWLHFGANAVLLYGLVAVLVGVGAACRARWRAERRWGWRALVAAVATQGFHVVDQTVRLVEYVASGGREPAGTLTRRVDPVWFHFTVNLVVLLGTVAACAGLRLVGVAVRSPAAPSGPALEDVRA